VNLRTRVALVGGMVATGALILVGAVLYPAVDAGLRHQIDASLIQAADQAPTSVAPRQDGSQAGLNSSPDKGADTAVGLTQVQIIPSARIGPGDPLVDVTARDVAVAAGSGAPYFQDADVRGIRYRIYSAQLAGSPRTLVRTARPESDRTSTLRLLAGLLIWLTLAAGLTAAVAARLIAHRVLSPVWHLIAAVEHIAATGDLTAKVDARGQDEIGRLGQAFTAMTSALDGSVGAQRRLVADASHELRTPLTSLTTNLELLAEIPADPQVPALAAEALKQAYQLKALINGLVDLARFGQPPSHTEDVRLDMAVERVVARRSSAVKTTPACRPVLVHGDPDALERAIANLVDNALKFATEGEVSVSTADRDGFGVIEVSDTGPGIPEADLPYIFDRFHRSPAARSLPGSGLGLAIVKQIVDAHGGDIEAVPQSPGVLFRVRLPSAEP
jgi:signal transduction histidine kinase